jgi:catechol 2,3-dioxygenase-like lactoylglutathione lyase family enzyme
MIDHLSLDVTDLARSRAFYDAVLAPLGYARRAEQEDSYGYGPASTRGDTAIGSHAFAFWIGEEPKAQPANGHVCFKAKSRAAVDAFYRAALAAGGRDNGAPGLRPEYHPTYYAAFVLDPDGHRLEAVTHKPE